MTGIVDVAWDRRRTFEERLSRKKPHILMWGALSEYQRNGNARSDDTKYQNILWAARSCACY